MTDLLCSPQQQQDIWSECSDPSFSLDVRDDDLFRVFWQVRFLSPLLSSGRMSASVKPKSTAHNCFPPHETQFKQLGSVNTLKTSETNTRTHQAFRSTIILIKDRYFYHHTSTGGEKHKLLIQSLAKVSFYCLQTACFHKSPRFVIRQISASTFIQKRR